MNEQMFLVLVSFIAVYITFIHCFFGSVLCYYWFCRFVYMVYDSCMVFLCHLYGIDAYMYIIDVYSRHIIIPLMHNDVE